MRSPSRSASSSGLSNTAPTPSPDTKPSAPLPNERQQLSRESIFTWLRSTCCLGCRIRLTPPVRAAPHSPLRMLSHARCTAVSEEEQAVSTAMLGPWESNRYETRFAIDQYGEFAPVKFDRSHSLAPSS